MPYRWLSERRDLAPLFIRVFAGTFLVYMSQDNVLSAARMQEFADFLGTHGFPLPRVCAAVSVWAQFLAGLLFLAGAFVREAAVVMIVNFVVAIGVVHPSLPFREALDPCAMLASALALLFWGAGTFSFDSWRARKSV